MAHRPHDHTAGPIGAAVAGAAAGLMAGMLLTRNKISGVRGSGARPGAWAATHTSATVEALVDGDIEQVFLRTVTMPLPLVFKASHGLPAITGTSVIAPWDAVGLSRTTAFASGDTLREEITHYDVGRYFAYQLSDFTFPTKYLADVARDEWWFSEEAGRVKIVWRFTYMAKHVVAVPVLALFVRLVWKGYMTDAIRLVQHELVNRGREDGGGAARLTAPPHGTSHRTIA